MPGRDFLFSGGNIQTVQTADPAAGAEISFTVAAGDMWRLLAVSVSNVQAAASTPLPALVLDDGTNVFCQIAGASAAQAISTTQRYTWAVGLPAVSAPTGAGANVYSWAPLPSPCVLLPGYRIRTLTAGIDANANFGPATLLVAEVA